MGFMDTFTADIKDGSMWFATAAGTAAACVLVGGKSLEELASTDYLMRVGVVGVTFSGADAAYKTYLQAS